MIPLSRAARARRAQERAQQAACEHELGTARHDGLGACYRTCVKCGVEMLDLDG